MALKPSGQVKPAKAVLYVANSNMSEDMVLPVGLKGSWWCQARARRLGRGPRALPPWLAKRLQSVSHCSMLAGTHSHVGCAVVQSYCKAPWETLPPSPPCVCRSLGPPSRDVSQLTATGLL
jgi:hypothetical protein